MRILGLSSFKRDPAAVLLRDGKVEAGIEDRKLLRSRTRGMPITAIESCLHSAGISWQDLDAVAVASKSLQGWLRRSWTRAKQAAYSPLANAYYEADDVGLVAQQLNHVRRLRRRAPNTTKIISLDHHLCHAGTAFFCSPFEKALILTLDEEGDGRSGMVAIGEGTNIRVLRTIPFPHSLAWVYTLITDLIGFAPREEEHKTQWLSLEGSPDLKDSFLKMLRSSSATAPKLNFSFFTRGLAGGLPLSAKFFQQSGLPGNPEEISKDQKKVLAASLQHACTQLIGDWVEQLRTQHDIQSVCLGGGLFQNTLLVSDLEKRLGMGQVSVPPAPGNSGCALGAAQLAWHQISGKPRAEAPRQVFWGPKFREQDIKDVLDNCKARYALHNTEDRKIDAVVQLLGAGKIVGWYQGATEFGPRALGHRSVLASPWGSYVKENLNDFIKHREWFRPFALAVPEEDCARYFDASPLCAFMNSLAWARPEASVLPEGLLFSGNRVRLQVVSRDANPLFWRLLKRFGEQAPAPILVNTSFNLFGEPLVVNPRDAVRSYFCSGIDALVAGNFILAKAGLPQSQSQTRLALQTPVNA
jgi:carbamoyltransferase